MQLLGRANEINGQTEKKIILFNYHCDPLILKKESLEAKIILSNLFILEQYTEPAAAIFFNCELMIS